MRLACSSGVMPKSLATSTAAPAATSARAISTLERWAAQRRGDDPSPERALTSAPDLIRTRTAWRLPALTAVATGPSPAATATVTRTATASKHAAGTRRTRVITLPSGSRRARRQGSPSTAAARHLVMITDDRGAGGLVL